MAYIQQISTALPAYKHAQLDILDYMLSTYEVPTEMVGKITAMYHKGGIDTRYSVLPDFNVKNNKSIFAKPNPLVQDRMAVYNANATDLGMQAANAINIDKASITHLITVSCTGMCAPGIDISIMQGLQLNANCVRTSVNFMGCYAAVHALKLANAFCATDAHANVLIVLVEFCTLHFQHEYSMENVATSMLFADGCAAVLVNNQKQEGSLHLKSFYSEVQKNSLQDMAWHITDIGFAMQLSSYVPEIIGTNIDSLLQKALTAAGLNKQDIKHWAIHPGGKKIVSAIQKSLDLTTQDVVHSNTVLKNHGNMSSVTLAFVLKEIMAVAQTGESIFGVAFGPGLTMETLILEAC